MSIATTQQAIDRGRISTYLSANYTANGSIFGARLAPTSPVTIAIVTDALDWGNSGGAQTAQSIRETSNYLVWLTGFFGQEAQAIIDGGGGGSVIPVTPGGDVPTPITISGSDFANTTDWEYAPYAGKNVTVFSNGIARYLTYLSEWEYISTGIRITMPGFDSSTMDYTMVITIIR